MIIERKTTKAEIFTENIEETAIIWVKELGDHQAFSRTKFVQLAYIHGGKSTKGR